MSSGLAGLGAETLAEEMSPVEPAAELTVVVFLPDCECKNPLLTFGLCPEFMLEFASRFSTSANRCSREAMYSRRSRPVARFTVRETRQGMSREAQARQGRCSWHLIFYHSAKLTAMRIESWKLVYGMQSHLLMAVVAGQ